MLARFMQKDRITVLSRGGFINQIWQYYESAVHIFKIFVYCYIAMTVCQIKVLVRKTFDTMPLPKWPCQLSDVFLYAYALSCLRSLNVSDRAQFFTRISKQKF